MSIDAFKIVILWTDVLVFLLLGAGIVFLWSIKRNSLQWQLWRKTVATPSRMIAALILLLYIIIGTLDSIHYREALIDSIDGTIDYSNTVKSVLDLLVFPLGTIFEKTYSAPFAIGQQIDIVSKIFRGLLYGLVIVGFLKLLSTMFFRIVQRKQKIKEKLPLFTYWATVTIIVCIICICYQLMHDYHIFGTDKVGRDVFFASIKSIRTGLIIGIATTVIVLPLAIILGTMAGYFRGIIDDIIQYIYTTLSSIPGVLLIAASVLTMQAFMDKHKDLFHLMSQRTDLRLLMLCVILGITSWTGLCRLLRGETLKIRELDYIHAARALGVGHMKIIFKHIVPNLMHIIIIAIVMDFSGLVLAEAVLSYVGVGVDPASFSWGNMINGARMEMARDPIVWWSLMGAFTLMFTLVLSANIFADGVRDVLDPRVH